VRSSPVCRPWGPVPAHPLQAGSRGARRFMACFKKKKALMAAATGNRLRQARTSVENVTFPFATYAATLANEPHETYSRPPRSPCPGATSKRLAFHHIGDQVGSGNKSGPFQPRFLCFVQKKGQFFFRPGQPFQP